MTDTADGAQRYRVLIADDNEGMRRVLAILLSPDTFALREVADGEEALAALTGGTFDLLLTDLNMPNRDGAALIRALRAMEAGGGRGTCAIAISGHEEAEAGALAAGADRVLPKPLQPSALLAAIVELLVD